MRKIAGHSLRTSPRSGRPTTGAPSERTARPTPDGTRAASHSGGSKLLLLPVDLPASATQPLLSSPSEPEERSEPVLIERRVRSPLARRRSPTPVADDAEVAEHSEPVVFKTRVAEPLAAELADTDVEAPKLENSDELDLTEIEEEADPRPTDLSPPAASPMIDAATAGPRRPAPERRTASRPATEPEPPSAEDASPPIGELHFGTLLRRARERQGLALADVADKTRISPRWIRALEDAQLDILPAPVFVSGYLRTYARLVGLDGQDLLERYQALARKRAQAQVPHERGFTVRRHGQQVLIPPWLLFLILLGVTGSVLAILWLTNTLWRR